MLTLFLSGCEFQYNWKSYRGKECIIYIRKVLKFFFKIRKYFEHHKTKIKTILHVFDHTVKPVLLYGSEVWGIFAVDKLQKPKDLYLNKLCTDFTAEKMHIKLCKVVDRLTLLFLENQGDFL